MRNGSFERGEHGETNDPWFMRNERGSTEKSWSSEFGTILPNTELYIQTQKFSSELGTSQFLFVALFIFHEKGIILFPKFSSFKWPIPKKNERSNKEKSWSSEFGSILLCLELSFRVWKYGSKLGTSRFLSAASFISHEKWVICLFMFSSFKWTISHWKQTKQRRGKYTSEYGTIVPNTSILPNSKLHYFSFMHHSFLMGNGHSIPNKYTQKIKNKK